MTGLQLDEQIARITLNQGATPQVKTMLTDALGSVIAIAKADQSLEVGYAYSPYGQTQKLGVENQQIGSENNSQYTGRENDQNGLYYYRARYYDPVLKRFISEDPIGLAGGINSHAYVEGDPVSFTDPLGLMGQGSGANRCGGNSPQSKDHNYDWTTFRCMGDCREQTMRELRCNPAPGVSPSTQTQTGDINTVRLAGYPLGNIMTAVSSTTNTTWNLTMPGHLLHPGWVRRDVVYDGTATWVVNTGGGTGFNPLNLNTILAPFVWGGTNPSRLPSGGDCSCGK